MNKKILSFLLSIAIILSNTLPAFASIKTWDFSTPADYVYDGSKIEVTAGQAQLKLSNDWYNSDWKYRKPVTIDNSSTTSTTDYAVKVNIIYDSKMRSDFGDIRFTGSDGITALNYWQESYATSTSAIYWVKIPSLPLTPATSIYMYYGNSSAATSSSGDSTFLLFDDENYYQGDIMPESRGVTTFGSLLTDANGHVVTHSVNKTYLYYLKKYDVVNNYWGTYVKELNLDTLELTGSETLVKDRDSGHPQATGHQVMKVKDDLYIMFYTQWPEPSTVKVAKCSTPDGSFQTIDGFEITPTTAWEHQLETNGAFSKTSEDETNLSGWLGYENMAGGGDYQIGWAQISIDKATGNVTLLGKHPNNPLTNLMFSGDYIYYGASNVDRSVTIGGKYLMMYLSRNSTDGIDYVSAAISSDPLFLTVDDKIKLLPDDEEGAAEKYQYYVRDNILYVFNESNDAYSVRARKFKLGATLQEIKDHPLPLWTTHINGGATSTVSVTTDPTTAAYKSSSLKLWDNTTTYSVGARNYFTSQSNKFVEEITVKTSSAFGFYVLGGYDTKTYSTTYQAIQVAFLNTGKIAYNDGASHDIMSYANNQWYKIKLIVDPATHKYDIYIDDMEIPKVTNVAFRNNKDKINYLSFSTTGNTVGTAWIDRLIVRPYVSPEPLTAVGEETAIYLQSNPAVYPLISQPFTSLSGIAESATKSGGEIKYQLSNDSGTTWYWYNAGWTTTTATYAEANIASDLNNHLATFPLGSGLFLPKAYLHSDGTQLVQLDTLELTYEGDTTSPTINSITSNNFSGAYKAGQTIQLNVNFSEVVNATSSVSLVLNTTPARGCTFTVSNSATSTCDYVVQDGDNAAVLNVAGVSGAIADVAGNLMTDFVPAANLSASKTIAIDTVAPTVSIFSFPIVNVANQSAVSISGTCSEGDLPVSLDIGGITATPACSSGAWSTTVDLHALTDGTITANVSQADTAGNSGSNSLASTKDTVNPAVTGLSNDPTPAKSKTWTWGSEIGATFRYSIDQNVDGAPSGSYGSAVTASQTSGNGTYYIHIQAKDTAENESAVATVSAILDNIAPTITIANPNTSAAQSKTITAQTNDGVLTMSNTNDSVCNSSLDFIAYSSQTFAQESDNGIKVCYKATDTAENIAYLMSDAISGIDTTLSTITINNPDTAAAQSKTITAQTSDGTLMMSNTGVAVCNETLFFIPYSDQIFTNESDNGIMVCYKAVDSADNTGYQMSNTIVGIDTTSPTIVGLVDDIIPAKSKTWTWSYGGESAFSRYAVDQNSTWTATGDFASTTAAILPSGNGTYYLHVQAQDGAGNDSAVATVSAIIDNTPPVITVSGDNPSTVAQGSTYADSGATATDNIDSGVTVTSSGAVDTATLGDYTITYNASDVAGNAATSATRLVRVTDQASPIISAVTTTPSRTSAAIAWTTSEASSSKVEYGLTGLYGNTTDEADTLTRVTSHSVTLSGLASCAAYHYRVKSKDANNNEGISNDSTFTTTGCSSGSISGDRGHVGLAPLTPTASAATADNSGTQKRIELLKQLIALLQQQLQNQIGNPQNPNQTTIPTNFAYSCAEITKTLSYGMEGAQVKCLQEVLKSQGPAIYPYAGATGFYLSGTRSAVKKFQEKYPAEILEPFGLEQGNGVAGINTRKMINRILAGQTATAD